MHSTIMKLCISYRIATLLSFGKPVTIVAASKAVWFTSDKDRSEASRLGENKWVVGPELRFSGICLIPDISRALP